MYSHVRASEPPSCLEGGIRSLPLGIYTKKDGYKIGSQPEALDAEHFYLAKCLKVTNSIINF